MIMKNHNDWKKRRSLVQEASTLFFADHDKSKQYYMETLNELRMEDQPQFWKPVAAEEQLELRWLCVYQ